MLWQAWQQDYNAPPPVAPTATETPAAPGQPTAATAATDVPTAATAPTAAAVPSASKAPGAPAPAADTAPVTPSLHVDVKTDLLRLSIDTHGATLAQADLLAYPQDPKDKTKPVRLLDDANATLFQAQSGLVSNTGPAPDHRAAFKAEKYSYELAPGADTLEVPLTWTDAASGISVRKVYILQRGSYLIETREEITNGGSAPWTGNEYRQLLRVPPIIAGGGFGFNNPEKVAFAGAAWYSPQDKFEKLPFDKFKDKPLKRDFAGGWGAMLQHYFFAAWIPPAAETDTYSTQVLEAGSPRYLIRAFSPAVTVAPGQTQTLAAHLYVGPTLESQLAAIEKAGIAQKLDLTADYGTLSFIAEPFHWLLVQLHSFVGNWGVAIILLVLLIKLAMFKLTEAQFRSMAKMRKLAPRMEALKERYGDDRQKLSQAQMELYQKEKINPLGGCLPMLIQIPVFFALYYVLLESVELRQAPFFGWIQNLSAPDPYFILPILNAAIMGASTWLTPQSPGMDPMQARMMKVMPLMFAVLFLFFPAGLVLYYTVNGGLSLLQQWIINRRMELADKAR